MISDDHVVGPFDRHWGHPGSTPKAAADSDHGDACEDGLPKTVVSLPNAPATKTQVASSRSFHREEVTFFFFGT